MRFQLEQALDNEVILKMELEQSRNVPPTQDRPYRDDGSQPPVRTTSFYTEVTLQVGSIFIAVVDSVKRR